MMTSKAREAKNAYQREWNRAHADRVKEYQNRYWSKIAEAAAAAQDAERKADK